MLAGRAASDSGLAARSEARWSRRNWARSEEHTSELQSQSNLVCRLLLEKKKTAPIVAQRRPHLRSRRQISARLLRAPLPPGPFACLSLQHDTSVAARPQRPPEIGISVRD